MSDINGEEQMRRLLKGACKPLVASPEFKERLFKRLTQEASGGVVKSPKRLWLKPVLWAPIAAAIALALIGYFVLLMPLATSPIVTPPPVLSPTPAPVPSPSPSPTPPVVVSTGILEIRVTDAPPEYEVNAINVTIAHIQIHQADDEEDGEASWITVIEEPKTFELLQLRGVEEILGEENIEAGHYTQIRLNVGSVIATIDGEDVDVVLPSGKLKLVGSFAVNSDEKTILTLDFDADKSLVFTGDGKVLFKPVVKLIVTEGDEEAQQ